MRHFDLLPRVAGEFVDDHGLHELRVSLTRGVWRLGSDHGAAGAGSPAGALVTAVFNDGGGDVDARWRRLTNSLSGQFCASLNFLDSALTSSPKWSLGPMGVAQPTQVCSCQGFLAIFVWQRWRRFCETLIFCEMLCI